MDIFKMRLALEAELVEIIKTGTADEFREGIRKHLGNHFYRILVENQGPKIISI